MTRMSMTGNIANISPPSRQMVPRLAGAADGLEKRLIVNKCQNVGG